MPDISMCQRADCPLAPKCYRFLAIPSEFMQSWASYDPKDGGCDSFWFATGSYRTRSFEQAVADLHQAESPVERRVANCPICQGIGWVCESHPDKPWDRDLPNGCECNAGMPCRACNPCGGPDDPPRPPEGTQVTFDKEGYRH